LFTGETGLRDWYLWKNFWTLTRDGLQNGSVYALVALGYTLVYGVLRLINFAHSEVFLLGTYGALLSMQWMGIEVFGVGGYPYETGFTLILVLLVNLAVAMAFSGTAAVLLERLAYRPLRKRNAPRLAFLISAIGASFVIFETVAWWRGRDQESYPRVLERRTLFTFFDADIRVDHVLVFMAAILMMVGLDQFVRRTRLGRGIRAVAQDPETAQIMGVNVDRVILLTFLLGGLLAGGAGMLWMMYREVTRFNIGFIPGIKAFTAAVLGGIGNIRGALLGGIVLGLIESYGSALFGGEWNDVVAYVVLVVVLMFRPTGLLGESLARARA
jgi:branched-chain amino acid transport system permease protein